jgi:hypothetical protein
MRTGLVSIALVSWLGAACGGETAGQSTFVADAGSITTGNAPDGGGNVAAVAVDNGPAAAGGSANVAYVSVTVCAPGNASLCQTVDHVQVDTGSSGLRLAAEVLGAGVTAAQLTQATDASGNPLVECAQFADGFSWGPVRLADVKIGGETASSVPIHVLGDPAFAGRTVPSACSSFVNVEENTVVQLGANGILGVGNFIQDCGPACASGSQDGSTYNICPTATSPQCQPAAVPPSQQVTNPAAAFAADNNGVLLQLPAVAAPGAASVSGSLVFGVGTRSNNGLGSAAVHTLGADGTFSTSVTGLGTFSSSFIDSGSNGYFFNDSALQACPGGDSFFYCPPGAVSFNASIAGANAVASQVSFVVDNAETDFNTNGTAFPNLAGSAGSGLGAETFDWGLPFFFGRPVYVVFEGKTAAGASSTGPYVAF